MLELKQCVNSQCVDRRSEGNEGLVGEDACSQATKGVMHCCVPRVVVNAWEVTRKLELTR